MSPQKSLLSLAVGMTLTAWQSPPVFAQDGAEPEEILVTARRREEAVQDVPVTMTTFSEEDIQAAGIGRPQDFISLTPGVTLVETQNQGTSFLTIRGISQARNSEPSAAILVDGVLLTNPAQLTQELFDVQSIEVLKGPQGAVYGRNAIGGAILITTQEPGDENDVRLRLGYDSGPGMKAQILGNGPIGGSDTLKYHAALSYYDTDGFIDNVYLNEEADPFEDTSMRFRLMGEPSDRLHWDARVYNSEVSTQALYFVISPNGANDTSVPVRVNNRGINNRDLSQVSFKLDYDADFGTFTSITSYDTIEEILTGDQYNFVPEQESFFKFLFDAGFVTNFPFGGYDWAQSQFLDVETVSQEIRFTSPSDRRVRWIAGAYVTATDRYISTSNTADPVGGGDQAFPVYREPRSRAQFPSTFQLTFLADSQDNLAWAVFGEFAADVGDRTEVAFALRYDEDTRENTTETPNAFMPLFNGVPIGVTGQVREETWDELQPRFSVRFQPSDDVTLFGSVGRGFRSGGFNQTGVEAAALASGFLGVRDLFDAEVADTIELGIKTQLADGRLNLNFSVYDTNSEGPYFFVFEPQTSTQNLGNIDEVDYQGYELDVQARLGDNFDLYFGYADVDSEIVEAADPSWVGNQAPLVTENTVNVGTQYRRPFGNGLSFFVRSDYRRIGDTWWDPPNTTVRDPVNLLDWRVGIEGDTWAIYGWQRNFNDVAYNTEWSPGPNPLVGDFLFPAPSRRWGVDFTKRF